MHTRYTHPGYTWENPPISRLFTLTALVYFFALSLHLVSPGCEGVYMHTRYTHPGCTVYTPRMHVRKIPNHHQMLSPTTLFSPSAGVVAIAVTTSRIWSRIRLFSSCIEFARCARFFPRVCGSLAALALSRRMCVSSRRLSPRVRVSPQRMRVSLSAHVTCAPWHICTRASLPAYVCLAHMHTERMRLFRARREPRDISQRTFSLATSLSPPRFA